MVVCRCLYDSFVVRWQFILWMFLLQKIMEMLNRKREMLNRKDAKGAKGYILFLIRTNDQKKNHALTGKKMSAN